MKKKLIFSFLLITALCVKGQDTSIDSTFGVNGAVLTTFANTHLQAKNIAIQPDNKILLCGNINSGSGTDMLLIRYLSNGMIDSSYGTNGLAAINLFKTFESAMDIKPLSSGGTLIGGYGKDSTGNYQVISKVNAQGKLDSSFGNNGKAIFAGNDSIIAIGVQSNGAIIAVSKSTMFRLTPAGFLDIGFGTNGFVTLGEVRDMIIQNDDKVIVTGGYGAVTKRFLANGTIDLGFASSGTYENFDSTNCSNPPKMRTNVVSSNLILDPSGGIYIGGIESRCAVSYTSNAFMFKLTSWGVLDTGFNKWKRNFSSSGSLWLDELDGTNIQVNNRLLTLSVIKGSGSNHSIGLNRILSNGITDSAFQIYNVFGSANYDEISRFKAGLQFDSCMVVLSAVNYSLLAQGIKTPHIRMCRYVSSISHNLPRPKFDVNKLFGDTNTEFTFTNKTVNGLRWKWSFQPSSLVYITSSSSSQAPRVRFRLPGKYAVKLVAINQHGSDSLVKLDYITIGLAPVARFHADRVLTDTTALIQLLDSSLNNPTTWEWEISPGSFSYVSGSNKNDQNPVVRFHTLGTYTIKLRVSNATGKDSLIKTSYITVSTPFIQARFTSSMELTDTSAVIQLYDQSLSTSNLSYQWEVTPNQVLFVNGTNWQSKNPSVKLPLAGNYSIKLRVSNSNGVDSLTKSDYLKIGYKPVLRFYENLTIGDTLQEFSFKDSSYNNPDTWNWKFNTSEIYYTTGNQFSKQIGVKFKKDGIYSVQLRVCNLYGCDSLTKTDLIRVMTLPTGMNLLSENNNSLEISPNPSRGFIFFRTPEDKISSIELIDIQGKTSYVKKDINQDEYLMDLNSLVINSGLYNCFVHTSNGIYLRKIVLLPRSE